MRESLWSTTKQVQVSFLALCLVGCATHALSPDARRAKLKSSQHERILARAPTAAIAVDLAAPSQPEGVHVRVVDVGNAECVVIESPDGYHMVYDTGPRGKLCAAAVDGMLGEKAIDLLVLSHGDEDHIGGVPGILAKHPAVTIFWTGDARDTQVWAAASKAIGDAAAEGTTVHSLQTEAFTPGQKISLGATSVYFLAGWGEDVFNLSSEAERRNVVSIVVRIEYEGHSILIAGDTIGRDGNADNSAASCEAAEKFMVDNIASVPMKSDVLVVPHHGANNASSTCFIDAVDPKFVVFPAGHSTYHHPRQLTAERYLSHGVNAEHIFRTDLGDDEGDDEWDGGRVAHCKDPSGDDDVDIWLPTTGNVEVAYRANTEQGCQ